MALVGRQIDLLLQGELIDIDVADAELVSGAGEVPHILVVDLADCRAMASSLWDCSIAPRGPGSGRNAAAASEPGSR